MSHNHNLSLISLIGSVYMRANVIKDSILWFLC